MGVLGEWTFLERLGVFGGVIGSALQLLIAGISLIIFLLVMLVIYKAVKRKKAFNIPVTIWIARSDNTIVDEQIAKGGYFKSSPVGGVTTFRLKRKGLSVVEIPPPSSRFLVGLKRHLYLVQKGMDDFEPVIPKSFLSTTTVTGKQCAIVDLKCINQDATAWAFDIQETSKKRFTIRGFWEKYKDFIQITIFIFIVFLAIYINWNGLKEVAIQLGSVADSLAKTARPIIR